MPRKTTTLTLQDRGENKTFIIEEMGSLTAEQWITDAGLLIASTGILDNDQAGDFSAVVAAVQENIFQHFRPSKLANFDKAILHDLLARLHKCISIKIGNVTFRLESDADVEQYIEDLRTLFTLQKEAFKMTFSFFSLANQSESPEGSTQPQAPTNTSSPVISRRK